VAIILAALWWWFDVAAAGKLSGFMRTADQQAEFLLAEGDATAAAARFQDPLWRAIAAYRAGDFKQAAVLYAGLSGAEAAYNHGNALVMLGQYPLAVARYDAAVALRPGWQPALDNRLIAQARGERVAQKGGEGTGGKLGADEIRFTAKSDNAEAQSEQQEVVEAGKVSDAELRAAWLRRVQTQPGDFLRAKFTYQLSTEPSP
jgi:Ca-activated chloride channel family protein